MADQTVDVGSTARSTKRILDSTTISRDRSRDQDTRAPKHQGNRAFMDIGEQRFQWQKPVSDFDAFYTLPNTMGKISPPFGSSTRADWEGTYKNKRDGANPYAGPGNYNTNNFSVLSTNPNAAKVKFGSGSRSASSLTDSPGPCYQIDGIWKRVFPRPCARPCDAQRVIVISTTSAYGRDRSVGPGFNKDFRKPMFISSTDATYYPKLPPATSVKVGQKLVKGSLFDLSTNRSPGPIYHTEKYDFKTGPKFTFGANKQDRFKHGIF